MHQSTGVRGAVWRRSRAAAASKGVPGWSAQAALRARELRSSLVRFKPNPKDADGEARDDAEQQPDRMDLASIGGGGTAAGLPTHATLPPVGLTPHAEVLLARLRDESQASLAIQQQLLDSKLHADTLELEVEGLRQERALMHERTERMGATLHMLEARNLRLSDEADALQQRMTGMAEARDVLMGERDALADQLRSQEQHDSVEATELRTRLDALQGELSRQQAAATTAASAQAALADAMAAAQLELTAARQQRDAALDQMRELQQGVNVAPSRGADAAAVDQHRASPGLQPARGEAWVPQHVADARGWIAAWRARRVMELQEELQQLRTQLAGAAHGAPAGAVPRNVQQARDWIAAWRARQSGEALQSDDRDMHAHADASRMEVERLEQQVQRLLLDRGIMEGNMAASVQQAQAMKVKLDDALTRLAAAEAGQETEVQLEEKVTKLTAELSTAHGALAAAEHARRDAETARDKAGEEVTAAKRAHNEAIAVLQRRLSLAEGMLAMRRRVARAHTGAAGAATNVAFTNTNRYWVPDEQVMDFARAWSHREEQLAEASGFMGLAVKNVATGVFEVSSQWASVPAWEAWSVQPTRTQLPAGVMQYVPRKGEGFPEDYVPWKDIDHAVDAKY